jgi:carbonic anhydrase
LCGVDTDKDETPLFCVFTKQFCVSPDLPKNTKPMQAFEKLLENNKEWAAQKLHLDSHYFTTLAKDQKPEFLWIGCSDSRVPAEEITQSPPGNIFVHRNVANLVIHTDLNVMSVLQYAVEVLQINHIIVCGHYGCGGVKAALQNKDRGLSNKWIRNIKEVYFKYAPELDSVTDEVERFDRLVEYNVIEQVYNLAETSIVQNAWKTRDFDIHGWVFDFHNGKIKDLNVRLFKTEDLHPIFRFDS